MKDSSSPEDKLLRLIRNPKKPSDVQSQKAKVQKSKTSLSASLTAPANTVKSGNFFNLRRIFLWLFIACGIYLISAVVYPWIALRNLRLPEISEKSTEEKRLAKDAARPLKEYLQSVKGRRIFSGAAIQGASLINVANIDLMRDINLVGIISGENPQAVIEDKKAQKTYYVTEGQFIGEMQVEDIQEGKIIINYAGQKYELYI